jgi:hypothetical protein
LVRWQFTEAARHDGLLTRATEGDSRRPGGPDSWIERIDGKGRVHLQELEIRAGAERVEGGFGLNIASGDGLAEDVRCSFGLKRSIGRRHA